MSPVVRSRALAVAFWPWPVLAAALFRGLGSLMVVTAAAMWFLPGSQTEADLVIMKLGVSLFFLLSGLTVMMIYDAVPRPTVWFDPVRREVRVLAPGAGGRPMTVSRRSYESLGRVRFDRRSVALYDMDGRLLLRVGLRDVGQRAALRAQLSRLVNICN
ncbi:hypothetical protein [Pseudodonghicola xiamenensis]|uniref:Uncharacterized protein n=1 Tax=Pseudodonghicola xiamenensis TaxID=337702 RepID=A0A8J3H2H4_9RHOB|nr:hypothetical protein [Pseudodonghicola xiamenensis]GHG79758.1 hypothetical protein GCM10010961_02120 [Pseudodonghicola xiamenensis]